MYLSVLLGLFASAPPMPTTALAYDPVSGSLAVGKYGFIELYDRERTLLAKLDGQTERVTALAFSPDGSRLAAASGAVGKVGLVRVYDVRHGIVEAKSVKEFAAHKDSILDLAFSPDGSILASCSYDRLVKLWTPAGQELRTLKDHSDSVYALSFHPNGSLLASAGADRAVKVWDTKTGTRLFTLGESTDWVYAVAFSPNGKQIIAGGVDKSVRVWDVTTNGGSLRNSVFAHEGAVTRLLFNHDGDTFFSVGEDRRVKAWDAGKLVEKKTFPEQPDAILAAALSPDEQTLAIGRFDGGLERLPSGLPLRLRMGFKLGESPRVAPTLRLPIDQAGLLERVGIAHFARFELKPGEEVGIRVTPLGSSKISPLVTLSTGSGTLLAESDSGLLAYRAQKGGTYAVGVRDREQRGGTDFAYRLQVGALPIVTHTVPSGGQRGTTIKVRLEGVHLGSENTIAVRIPADAEPGTQMPIPWPSERPRPFGKLALLVGEFPQVDTTTDRVPNPGIADDLLPSPGMSRTWKFTAIKGERRIIEVHADRIGSPLDPQIEILDEQGKLLPRAVLRCTAKVFTTFRDVDSAQSGIRLESWNELAMNDLVLVGTELMRIDQLPRNPDDDCRFVTEGGKRVGYLGTTPTAHAMGEPMYKVEVHPPGSTFPPNGMPIFPIMWRNDDGGARFRKDAMLDFVAPNSGTFQIRVSDSRHAGGPNFFYRLTVRPAKPDFRVKPAPIAPMVRRGDGIPVTITAERLDGYQGPIRIEFLDLPAGLRIPETFIEADQESTVVPLTAAPDAELPKEGVSLRLRASATIDGKQLTQVIAWGPVKLAPPADLRTSTPQSEVVIRPGRETKLLVKIERRNGFNDRVPIEFRGLPHGVRVLNIGLNGILILAGQTEREVVLYAEPWVQPQTKPATVLSKHEKAKTEHAASALLIRVTP